MASFRRLLPLCSSFNRTSFPSSGVHEGFRENIRRCSGIASIGQTVSKFGEGMRQNEAENLEANDDIDKIRFEFDAAKRSFLKNP